MSIPDLEQDRKKTASPRAGLMNRSRKVACVATLTAAGLSFGLVACGGSGGTDGTAQADPTTTAQVAPETTGSSSGTGTTGNSGTTGSTGTTGQSGEMPQGAPPGGAGGPMELTNKQRKCLAGQGIDLPDSSSGSGGSGDGNQGSPPDQGSMPDREEMDAAMEACGIDMPDPPSGGQGDMPQPPSGQAS